MIVAESARLLLSSNFLKFRYGILFLRDSADDDWGAGKNRNLEEMKLFDDYCHHYK